jgi:hypothetical protein
MTPVETPVKPPITPMTLTGPTGRTVRCWWTGCTSRAVGRCTIDFCAPHCARWQSRSATCWICHRGENEGAS